jgi:hypothetical protein
MSDKDFGLRTISRLGIYRQALTSGGVPIKLPLPMVSAPTVAKIVPNEEELELLDVNCKGEEVVGLVVTKGFKPELQLEFSEGLPEMDSFVHGRLMESKTSIAGFVFTEFTTIPGQTNVAARVTGEVGFEVTAQTAKDNSGLYYIDRETKLAKELALVAVSATPADDEISIDAALAIEYSTELATQAVTIRGWVPCTFAKATVITSKPLGLLSVYGMGVDFAGRVANLTVQNCARRPGGEIGSDPKRTVSLRILPDPNDGNGLGYQMRYLDKTVAC